MQSDVFNHQIEPLPYAPTIYQAAHVNSRQVIYITARDRRTRLVTENWLRRMGEPDPVILYAEGIYTTKGDLAFAAGVTLMVEDTLAEAHVVGNRLGPKRSLLLDLPWNKEDPGVIAKPYQRLTVEEIVEVMQKSEEGKAWRGLLP